MILFLYGYRNQTYMNFADANARAIIAFSLTLIAALLVYIAFFKDSASKKRLAK